jgi:hypothetical protein
MDKALDLFARWKEANPKAPLPPRLLQRVLQVASIAGDTEVAVEILNQLKRLDKKNPGSVSMWECYSFAVKALCVAGKPGEALDLFFEAKYTPGVDNLDTLIGSRQYAQLSDFQTFHFFDIFCFLLFQKPFWNVRWSIITSKPWNKYSAI